MAAFSRYSHVGMRFQNSGNCVRSSRTHKLKNHLWRFRNEKKLEKYPLRIPCSQRHALTGGLRHFIRRQHGIGRGFPAGSSGGAVYELAVVTDANSIDDRGFNQGAWEGLAKYAEENNITHQYYRPIDQSTDGYLVAIESAVNNGAKLVVCPGYLFEAAVYKAQDMYPDVSFIILDGTPQDGTYTDYKTADNTYSIVFAEEQAGFLAGYAAVKDGYRDLGFFGAMAVPSVVRYGYGYLQGAEYAARELGLEPGAVSCKYHYTGTFDILPENQTNAACESVGGDCVAIGVDLDQSASSETVLTSAMKNLSVAVYDGITMFYNGEFPGGVNARLDIKDNAVGLPMETSRFKNFTQADYDAIAAKMAADEDGVVSGMVKDVDESGNSIDLETLVSGLSLVNVEVIN